MQQVSGALAHETATSLSAHVVILLELSYLARAFLFGSCTLDSTFRPVQCEQTFTYRFAAIAPNQWNAQFLIYDFTFPSLCSA